MNAMPSFTNQATLTYRGNVAVSNIVTGELVAVLSAAKTALSETYGADDTVTYVVSLVNSGSVAYTGLTVTDDLGSYVYGTGTLVPLTYVDGSLRYFVNGVLQATVTPTAVSPLTVTGISVPAGGNALLIYEARVNSFAPLGTDESVTNTVSTRAAAYLTINKALSPATVAENGSLTYTFTIQNYGNTAAGAEDELVVTDTFDPALSGLSVTYDGGAWTEGTQYTYDAATGVFATLTGQITVPAATYTRDATTGAVVVAPGVRVLTVSGTV